MRLALVVGVAVVAGNRAVGRSGKSIDGGRREGHEQEGGEPGEDDDAGG